MNTFGTITNGIRLTSIIPAGGWVVVMWKPGSDEYTIEPLVAWALGDCAPEEDSVESAGQFVRGLVVASDEGPSGATLVSEDQRGGGYRTLGYFGSEAAAITRIKAEASCTHPTAITLIDGSTLEARWR